MEKKLYRWFLKQRDKHLPISGESLKIKAKDIYYRVLGNENFTASDGWLQRFKRRYGIRWLKIADEKLSAKSELVEPFIQRLRDTIEKNNLTSYQLYNADEKGLFWKLLPDKTYVTHKEKMAPGKKSEKQSYLSGMHKCIRDS